MPTMCYHFVTVLSFFGDFLNFFSAPNRDEISV